MKKSSYSSFQTAFLALPWKTALRTIPGLLAIYTLFLAFLGPIFHPVIYAIYFVFLHLIFLTNIIRASWGTFVAAREVVKHSKTDWCLEYCKKTNLPDGSDNRHDIPYDSVKHVILLPNYKENMDTLCETLDVLASHSRAATQYKVT